MPKYEVFFMDVATGNRRSLITHGANYGEAENSVELDWDHHREMMVKIELEYEDAGTSESPRQAG